MFRGEGSYVPGLDGFLFCAISEYGWQNPPLEKQVTSERRVLKEMRMARRLPVRCGQRMSYKANLHLAAELRVVEPCQSNSVTTPIPWWGLGVVTSWAA